MRVWQASFYFYIYSYVTCILLRTILRLLRLPESLSLFLNEVIATIQVCLPIFDVDIIYEEYGLFGVFMEIFILEYVNCKLVDEESFTTPCYFLTPEVTEECIIRPWKAPVLLVGEILGALLCYPLALLFWMQRIHPEHSHNYQEDNLGTDFHTNLVHAMLLELGGTLIGRIFELQCVGHTQTNQYCHAAPSFMYSIITVFGLTSTGMYCHPISALACLWPYLVDQSASVILSHMTIYLVSPLIGWFIAEWLYKLLYNYGTRLYHSYPYGITKIS